MIKFLARRHVAPPAADDMASALAHGHIVMEQQRQRISELETTLMNCQQANRDLFAALAVETDRADELASLLPFAPLV